MLFKDVFKSIFLRENNLRMIDNFLTTSIDFKILEAVRKEISMGLISAQNCTCGRICTFFLNLRWTLLYMLLGTLHETYDETERKPNENVTVWH